MSQNKQIERHNDARTRSSNSAVRDAKLLRFTSETMLLLSIPFAVVVSQVLFLDFESALSSLHTSALLAIVLPFLAVSIWHMTLAMRSVIFDYVPHSIQRWALCFNTMVGLVAGLSLIVTIAILFSVHGHF